MKQLNYTYLKNNEKRKFQCSSLYIAFPDTTSTGKGFDLLTLPTLSCTAVLHPQKQSINCLTAWFFPLLQCLETHVMKAGLVAALSDPLRPNSAVLALLLPLLPHWNRFVARTTKPRWGWAIQGFLPDLLRNVSWLCWNSCLTFLNRSLYFLCLKGQLALIHLARHRLPHGHLYGQIPRARDTTRESDKENKQFK